MNYEMVTERGKVIPRLDVSTHTGAQRGALVRIRKEFYADAC